jgi:hypothetical protein
MLIMIVPLFLLEGCFPLFLYILYHIPGVLSIVLSEFICKQIMNICVQKESNSGLPPSCSCRQFGNAVGVSGAMGKHPAVTWAFLSPFSTPLAVALCTALNPALKVVNAVGGKNFARGGVVSKMCHNFFSSLLGGSLPPCDYIIPQNPSFVKGFCKSFLRIFCLFEDVGNNVDQAENSKGQPKGNLRE